MSSKARVGRCWRTMGAGVAALAAVPIVLTAVPASAESHPTRTDMKAFIAMWDKGPATIDVANYPAAPSSSGRDGGSRDNHESRERRENEEIISCVS
ncbi:MAG: hypothetical protein AAB654_12125 [Acidobacteriota bacterium]